MVRGWGVWLVCVGVWGWLGVVCGDVVHLTNGGRIQGEVQEETPAGVWVRFPGGRQFIRRELIAEIERESLGALRLDQARQALRNDDRERAERLYERAVEEAQEEGDARLEEEARGELEALRASGEGGGEEESGGVEWTGGEDPLRSVEETEALVLQLEAVEPRTDEVRLRLRDRLYRRGQQREQERRWVLAGSDYVRARDYAAGRNAEILRGLEHRCRLRAAIDALTRGDGAFARAVVEPAARDPEEHDLQDESWFVLGEAYELLRLSAEAREAYVAALENAPIEVPTSRPVPILRELARLASSGVRLDASAPGVGDGWRWTRTSHFGVLHQLESSEGRRVALMCEEARRVVLERLRLPPMTERTQIAVFVYRDGEGYRGSAGARAWSAGHARRQEGPFGVVRSIYVHAQTDLEDTIRHEVAHILVGDALEGALLPAWVSEGSSVYVESDEGREALLGLARQLGDEWLGDVEGAVGNMLPPLTQDAGEARAFYARAALLFEALARRERPWDVLEAMSHVNEQGAEEALGRLGLGFAEVEGLVRQAME